jgi:hypothetical protein
MRRLLSFLLSLSLLAAAPTSARAQAEAYAEITAIEARTYPQVSALVDIFGANGEFLADLEPSDLTVYEDGQPRPVDALAQSDIPVQIVVAVNPAPPLAVRDGTGIDRYTRLVEVLGAWAASQPADSQDDISLVSLSGSLISHARPEDWFVSLSSFKPDFRATTRPRWP